MISNHINNRLNNCQQNPDIRKMYLPTIGTYDSTGKKKSLLNNKRRIMTIEKSLIYKRIITVYIKRIAFIYYSHRVWKFGKKIPSNTLDFQ